MCVCVYVCECVCACVCVTVCVWVYVCMRNIFKSPEIGLKYLILAYTLLVTKYPELNSGNICFNI